MTLFGRSRSIRRNTAWMLASRTLRTLVAAGYFALLARALGVMGYGTFAAACALAGILAPFASLGTGNILIQSVSRDHSQFPERWAQCLTVTILSGTFLTALVFAIAPFALAHSIPLSLIACIAIADLIFARLLDVVAQAFQSFDQLHVTAALTLGLSASRILAAATLFFTIPHATAAHWSAFYLIGTAIPALVALRYVHTRLVRRAASSDDVSPGHHSPLSSRGAQRLGICCSSLPRIQDLRDGLHFSIGFAAQSIYNDLDKAMLARLCTLGAAGLYAAAYRIVDAAFSPILSVLAATYTRFFQHGAHGLHATTRFAKRLLLRAAIYSLCAIAALWVCAPYLPRVLGKDFAEAVCALRWLSPLILLRTLHYFAADSLTGAGHQRIRTAAQIFVAVLNAGLNFAILPRYSWRGAIATSLISDAALAFILWTALFHLRARESAHPAISQPAVAEA